MATEIETVLINVFSADIDSILKKSVEYVDEAKQNLEKLMKDIKTAASNKNYEKAIELDPKDEDTWINRGVVLGKMGRHQEELKSYETAAELNPEDNDAWVNKGVALGKLGDNEEALEAFNQAWEG